MVYENYLRNTRPFNKIKEIYTDQDGQIRVVDVARYLFTRTKPKICD